MHFQFSEIRCKAAESCRKVPKISDRILWYRYHKPRNFRLSVCDIPVGFLNVVLSRLLWHKLMKNYMGSSKKWNKSENAPKKIRILFDGPSARWHVRPTLIWNFQHEKQKQKEKCQDLVLCMINQHSWANSQPVGNALSRFSGKVRDGWFLAFRIPQKVVFLT